MSLTVKEKALKAEFDEQHEAFGEQFQRNESDCELVSGSKENLRHILTRPRYM